MKNILTVGILVFIAWIVFAPNTSSVSDSKSKYVLIVEESNDRHKLPNSQKSIFVSPQIDEAVAAHKATMRIFDQNEELKYADPIWSELMNKPRKSLPWIVIDGKKLVSKPLPLTVQETTDLLNGSL